MTFHFNMRNLHLQLAVVASLALCAVAQAEDCSFSPQKSPPGKAQALAQEAAKINPCTTVPGLTAKSLSSVWSVLLTSATQGGKRFETIPPVGTPTGKVLATYQGVIFDLGTVIGEGVLSLQVKSAGTSVFSVSSPSQHLVTVPLDRLKPGATYDWVLDTRKTSYRASFELLDAEETRSVQTKLTAIAKTQLDEQVRLLYTAAVYDDAELYLDRDQALEELRRQVTQ